MLVSIFHIYIPFSRNKCCLFVACRRGMYCRLSELDTAIADAFCNRVQQIRNDELTRSAKTVCVSEKWKMGFNSSLKIHKELLILDPGFFWLLCSVC